MTRRRLVKWIECEAVKNAPNGRPIKLEWKGIKRLLINTQQGKGSIMCRGELQSDNDFWFFFSRSLRRKRFILQRTKVWCDVLWHKGGKIHIFEIQSFFHFKLKSSFIFFLLLSSVWAVAIVLRFVEGTSSPQSTSTTFAMSSLLCKMKSFIVYHPVLIMREKKLLFDVAFFSARCQREESGMF